MIDMEHKELQDKSREELTKVLGEQRAALAQFRFQIATGQQKDVRAGRDARKTIARILTSLRTRADTQ